MAKPLAPILKYLIENTNFSVLGARQRAGVAGAYPRARNPGRELVRGDEAPLHYPAFLFELLNFFRRQLDSKSARQVVGSSVHTRFERQAPAHAATRQPEPGIS